MVWQSWSTSAALWDPLTGNFSDPQFPSVNIFCAGHTWLPDGRLLVVGGQDPLGNYFGEPVADIYDPYTGQWASRDPNVPDVPAMNAGRWYPSATTMGNGDVLVLSGDTTAPFNSDRNLLPQLYDYKTNTWRSLHGADGNHLPLYPRTFAGPNGTAAMLSNWSNETQILDTSGDGSWQTIDRTLDNNLNNYGPAVMYDAGKIAYIGGGHSPTQNISLLDLNDEMPEWRYASQGMAQPRRQNDATILADGTVLISGGSSVEGWNDPNGSVAAAEIWDPITQDIRQVAEASSVYRGYHSTAVLLPDGRVLITGGDHDHGGFTSNLNAEIYEPPYLHQGSRPAITEAPETVAFGETFFVATPNDNLERAMMIVPSTTTHAQNWSQRAIRLSVTDVEGGVMLTMPTDSHQAPPGNYMLFLVDDTGVPSVSSLVRAEFGLDGDFNGDGTVDAADFTVFRDFLGKGYESSDYDLWVNNFGRTLPNNVPEPDVGWIGFLFFVSCMQPFRRRTAR